MGIPRQEYWKGKGKVAQPCPTLCDPREYTVQGILQARILEWVTFPFPRSRLLFPPPGDLPDPGIKPTSIHLLHCLVSSLPLALAEKPYDQPREHVKKQRHHFANKGSYSQSYGSSSHGHERCTIKKAERLTKDDFELWCWRRLLRVLGTRRRSNQSILKEINPEYSLEILMLKLKLQYIGHLIQKASSLEKTLMLGKIEDRRRRGQQRMSWLDGITDSMDMGLSKL